MILLLVLQIRVLAAFAEITRTDLQRTLETYKGENRPAIPMLPASTISRPRERIS
jgi:hypothetical protein